MPAISLPAIAAIASIVAAGTGVGLELDQTLNQPKTTSTTTQPLTTNQQQQIRGAVSQQTPNLQTQLGGSVSPEYYLQNSQLLSGTSNVPGAGGTAQSVINQLFGNNGTGTSSAPVNPGPSTSQSFVPAGISANSGGGYVDSGISDLFQKLFAG